MDCDLGELGRQATDPNATTAAAGNPETVPTAVRAGTALELISLEARAFVQPLGKENAWVEVGEGRCEIVGSSLRVVAEPSPTSAQQRAEAVDSMLPNPTKQVNPEEGPAANACLPPPRLLLEDTIVEDMPFVAKDSCLVWNCLEQATSMCIMFTYPVGFACTWSAIQYLQHKPAVPIGINFFAATEEEQRRATKPSSSSDPVVEFPSPARDRCAATLALLSSNVPIGFIERRALAMCIQEYDLAKQVLVSKGVCLALIRCGDVDLMEYLLSDSAFGALARGLVESDDGATSAVIQEALQVRWCTPDGLPNVPDLPTLLQNALRVHYLKNRVLPVETEEEVIAFLDGLSHRYQNEAVVTILGRDEVLASTMASLVVPRTQQNAQQQEQVVCCNLKFLTSLLSMTVSTFFKELVPHVIARICRNGQLIEALGRVAELYLALPPPALEHACPSIPAAPQSGCESAAGPNSTPTTPSLPLIGALPTVAMMAGEECVSSSASIASNSGRGPPKRKESKPRPHCKNKQRRGIAAVLSGCREGVCRRSGPAYHEAQRAWGGARPSGQPARPHPPKPHKVLCSSDFHAARRSYFCRGAARC